MRASACILLTAALLTGCGSDGPTSPSPGLDPEPNTFTSAHFDFYLYDGLQQDQVQVGADALEANVERIVQDLRVGVMPRVRVRVWSDQNSFYAAMRQLVGTTYYGSTGYLNGPSEICVLLVPDLPVTLVHEYAHVVSLRVSRTLANNPRWLWEAVALYEAQEFVDPGTLPFMQRRDFPTLEQLNVPYNQGAQIIYQVGYVLAQYIVETWGTEGFIALIRSNGDIHGILGLTVREFEQAWHTWLESRFF